MKALFLLYITMFSFLSLQGKLAESSPQWDTMAVAQVGLLSCAMVEDRFILYTELLPDLVFGKDMLYEKTTEGWSCWFQAEVKRSASVCVDDHPLKTTWVGIHVYNDPIHKKVDYIMSYTLLSEEKGWIANNTLKAIESLKGSINDFQVSLDQVPAWGVGTEKNARYIEFPRGTFSR